MIGFQPVIPSSGLVGWKFLERTYEAQNNAFQKSSEITRDTDYFEAKIGEIDTAEELVADRRLLRVALGAFGLDADIDSKFYVKKILEEGTLTDGALANRLADDRYKEFSAAFGFGNFDTPSTKISDFGAKITAQYRAQQFEVAVGDQDENMRLALYTERELANVAEGTESNDTKWFKIMGTPPLRSVFETALGLPASFGQLDLDLQLSTFKDYAQKQFGTKDISDFSDPEMQEK
ncbi:MAG: DUF1217 domain-containing protein, partial [Rhodobacterales bacterium]|nr:DUF1217 domain-containing protein [Rhodobacterales bacterium]